MLHKVRLRRSWMYQEVPQHCQAQDSSSSSFWGEDIRVPTLPRQTFCAKVGNGLAHQKTAQKRNYSE